MTMKEGKTYIILSTIKRERERERKKSEVSAQGIDIVALSRNTGKVLSGICLSVITRSYFLSFFFLLFLRFLMWTKGLSRTATLYVFLLLLLLFLLLDRYIFIL